MSYNIRFHPAAKDEYLKAYQWYEEHLEGLGDRFGRSVERQINLISSKVYFQSSGCIVSRDSAIIRSISSASSLDKIPEKSFKLGVFFFVLLFVVLFNRI